MEDCNSCAEILRNELYKNSKTKKTQFELAFKQNVFFIYIWKCDSYSAANLQMGNTAVT